MTGFECSVCLRPFWSMEERAVCPVCRYMQKSFVVVYADEDGWHVDKCVEGAWQSIGVYKTQKEAMYEADKANYRGA